MEKPITAKGAKQIGNELESKKLKQFVRDVLFLDDAIMETLAVNARVSIQGGVCSYRISIDLDAPDGRYVDKVGDILEQYCKLRVAGMTPAAALIEIRKSAVKTKRN